MTFLQTANRVLEELLKEENAASLSQQAPPASTPQPERQHPGMNQTVAGVTQATNQDIVVFRNEEDEDMTLN